MVLPVIAGIIGTIIAPLAGVFGVLALLGFFQDVVISTIIFGAIVFGAITLFKSFSDNASLNPSAAFASLLFGIAFFGIGIYVMNPTFFSSLTGTKAITNLVTTSTTTAAPALFCAGCPPIEAVPLSSTAIGSLQPWLYWILWVGLVFLVIYVISKYTKFKIIKVK